MISRPHTHIIPVFTNADCLVKEKGIEINNKNIIERKKIADFFCDNLRENMSYFTREKPFQ